MNEKDKALIKELLNVAQDMNDIEDFNCVVACCQDVIDYYKAIEIRERFE